MESVGVNVIETAALGRPFQLGMLYDCRKDALIPGIRLWTKEQLEQNSCTRPQIKTRFNVTASDTIKDKSKLLDIHGELKLSFLSGLLNVSGAADYLNDTKTSFNQQRMTLHYHSSSRFDELTVNHLPSQKIPEADSDIGTHVVTGIQYGADACFVFDREVSSDEDTKTVQGEATLAFEKLQSIISVSGNAKVNMDENQKDSVKNLKCTFYGDFKLESNPSSFEDALNIFANLPKLLKENQKLTVPLRVWLYPLDKLLSIESKLQNDISLDLIMKTEAVIESLNTAEMKCSDLLKDSPALAFAEFHDKIVQMKQNCNMYKLKLVKQLGLLLPNIRGDLMKETALNDLLQDHNKSPFKESDLAEWLKQRERESEIIKSILGQLKDVAEAEVNLDAILMDLEVENLVSYTFTSLNCSDELILQQTAYLSPPTQGETNEKSLDSKQKSWLTPGIQKSMRRNLKIFKNLIDSKDRKPAKFVVSFKEMKNNPGSCILLYESECDEAVFFTPPSQPTCPIAEEVKDTSVVLKVPPSCPVTVELRLLYKPKQDSVWRSQPILKDQDTVTLTDLREETEYEFKCAALGKLDYTRESDMIRVTTEQRKKNNAVKESMDSKNSKKTLKKSLIAAEDMINLTKLMMQPYVNWKEYLRTAPLSIAIMGELVFRSSTADFSVNKNAPREGYTFIKHPESFRACVMQACYSVCWAFNEAHKSIDWICHLIAQVPDCMKTAVKIVFQDSDEVINAHLPDQLDFSRDAADECLELINATEKHFTDVINIIQELLEACVNAEHFYREEMDEIKKIVEEQRSVEDVVAEINAYSKSAEILLCVQHIQQQMNVNGERNEIDWTNLYDQQNKHIVTDFTECQLKRISEDLMKVSDCSAKKKAQTLCKQATTICKKLAKYAPDGKCDKDKSMEIIDEVKELIKLAQVFDCKCKDITNSPAISPMPPMMNKERNRSENTSHSQRASENARFAIEQTRAQMNKTREIYKKCMENHEKNQKELNDILVTMRNCKLKETDFQTTINMLVKVRKQLEKTFHFFQMISNIVKANLSTTLKNFVSTFEKKQALSYNAKLFCKDLLYHQAFQISNIASLVHMISKTYTDVSNKHLMDCVRSLDKLMAMDKDKPVFEFERQRLQNSCDEAKRGILWLVLKNKKTFDRKSTARLERIDQELAFLEQIKSIQEDVQAGFTEEEEASYY